MDTEDEFEHSMAPPVRKWPGWLLWLAVGAFFVFMVLWSHKALADGIWRPGVVVFVTGEFRPMEWSLRQLPGVFFKEAECWRHLAKERPKIDKDYTTPDILHHDVECFLDETGDPA